MEVVVAEVCRFCLLYQYFKHQSKTLSEHKTACSSRSFVIIFCLSILFQAVQGEVVAVDKSAQKLEVLVLQPNVQDVTNLGEVEILEVRNTEESEL